MLKIWLFMLASAIVHIVVLGMSNRPIFEISENKKQGSSSLMVELSTNDAQELPPVRLKKQISSVVHDTVINDVKVDDELDKLIDKKKAISSKDIALTGRSKHRVIKKTSLDNAAFMNKKVVLKDQGKIKDRHIKLNASNHSEKIKTLLNKELSKYFYYPKSARRKNRQGKVVLAFTINSSGLIEHVRVDMSSGYALLDEAAIKAFKKIEVNKPLEKILLGMTAEYTLPISYRLH